MKEGDRYSNSSQVGEGPDLSSEVSSVRARYVGGRTIVSVPGKAKSVRVKGSIAGSKRKLDEVDISLSEDESEKQNHNPGSLLESINKVDDPLFRDLLKLYTNDEFDMFSSLYRAHKDDFNLEELKLNDEGETVLHHAAFYGRGRFVQFICHEEPEAIKLPGKDGNTPAHYAAYANQKKVLEFLVSQDPNVLEYFNNKAERVKNIIFNGQSLKCVPVILRFDSSELVRFFDLGNRSGSIFKTGIEKYTRSFCISNLMKQITLTIEDVSGRSPSRFIKSDKTRWLARVFGSVFLSDDGEEKFARVHWGKCRAVIANMLLASKSADEIQGEIEKNANQQGLSR